VPIAKVNDVNLYYEIHGAGPNVLLSHGLGSTHMHWWQQVASLSQSFRLITFDHRGFGFSTDDGRGASAFVDDLVALLDYLDVPTAALVGQSMGGFTVAGVAALHPNRVSALVLSSSSAGLVTSRAPTQYVMDRLKDAVDYSSLAHILIHQDGFPRRQPALCFLCEQMAQLNHQVNINLIPSLSSIRHSIDSIRLARTPVLLLGGDEDEGTINAMREIASLLPCAQLRIVPGTGHLLFFENAAIYNKLLSDFLVPLLT
jgi:pimeloyl-ACP methyl ester carboxylesterase